MSDSFSFYKALLRTGAFLVLLVAAAIGFDARADDAPQHRGPPPSAGPVKVHIGINVLNVTDVDEKEETVQFEGIITLRWHDPRLAYDPKAEGLDSFKPGDYSRPPPRIYQGDFAVKEVFQGWRPHVLVINGIGDRQRSGMAVGVWPDGMVSYTDYFHATVETPMNLRRFPFDRQDLKIFLSVQAYPRNHVVLIYDQTLSGVWEQDRGIAGWKKLGVRVMERPYKYLTPGGSLRAVYSQLVVTLSISRVPVHFLFSFVLPLLALVALTWSVFWLDKASISDRMNISFIGILTVVAYYFVMSEDMPAVPYLTLTDAFILVTVFVLAGTVIVNLAVDRLNRANREAAGDQIDRICRWAFPVGYAGSIGAVFVSFLFWI